MGIYFEANGHGTVIFSERFQAALAEWPHECIAVERLQVRRIASSSLTRRVSYAFNDTR